MDTQTLARPQAAITYDTPLFRLGRCVATLGVDNLICRGDVNPQELLHRHQCGDWGEMPPEDLAVNRRALQDRSRLMSVYKVGGKTIWVITDADWAVTTLLLPSEY
ncbi:type I restriction endonuclease subunit M [Alicycliphilus denitrificans]|uniref:type I restriction endonuclease subunit M n=1 Tax=Alicycliphilus denitrificans TaxID=179636 RepID=UPI00384FFE1A